MNAIAAILPVIRVKRPKFINTLSSEILAYSEDSDFPKPIGPALQSE